MFLLVSVDDAATGQIVGRQLHNNSVLGQDTDVVLAHLATDVCKNFVSVIKLDTEHCVWQGFNDATLNLNSAFLLAMSSTFPSCDETTTVHAALHQQPGRCQLHTAFPYTRCAPYDTHQYGRVPALTLKSKRRARTRKVPGSPTVAGSYPALIYSETELILANVTSAHRPSTQRQRRRASRS